MNISKVSKNGSALKVEWNDGEVSNFNFLWLRDNCPSEIHKTARERTFNILNISENIAPESFKMSEDGKLEVKWNEDKHVSYYEPSWLRKNCYTIKRKKAYVSPYQLWDNSLQKNLNSISIEHNKIIKSEKGLIKWLELLHYKGIAIIKNAPTEKESAIKILDKISYTRQTFFGTPFEVINLSKPNNFAYTADSLPNHIDLPYVETPPGYQFLHCIVHNAEGGNSSAVDGFKVADYLKHNDKETFNILKRIPIKFGNKDYTQNKRRVFHAPAITLTKDGDYNDIRFSITHMGIMDCSPEDIEPFYKAHYKFAKLIHSEKFNIKFRLEPGDIFCFNNRRVLHGRTKYNPNSGNRHLQGYYMDRDEIVGRLNYLKNDGY